MDTFNYADPRAVAKAKKAAQVTELERKTVIQGIMSVRAGREWIHHLLESCGIGRTPWAGDDAATNFNCGQQNVGLLLQAEVMLASPDEYIIMMKEQSNAGRDPATDLARDDGTDYADGDDPGDETLDKPN